MSLKATKYSVIGNIASKLRVQWPCYVGALSVGQTVWCEVMGWSMSSELERLWKGIVS